MFGGKSPEDYSGRVGAGKGEDVMQPAASSTLLAPTCRNSQKGIKELLRAAAAADEDGLQH